MSEPRVRDVLQLQPQQQTVTVHGWVRTKRDTKNVTFFELSDAS